MYNFFNYNSWQFTFIAIFLMIGIFYFNHNDTFDSSKEIISTEGAKYVMQLDPNTGYGNKSFSEKVVLFFFKDKINQNLKQQLSKNPKENVLRPIAANDVKIGDKVKVLYYKTNPMPSVLPKPINIIVGDEAVAQELSITLLSMKPGDKKSFIIGSDVYDIELIDRD